MTSSEARSNRSGSTLLRPRSRFTVEPAPRAARVEATQSAVEKKKKKLYLHYAKTIMSRSAPGRAREIEPNLELSSLPASGLAGLLRNQCGLKTNVHRSTRGQDSFVSVLRTLLFPFKLRRRKCTFINYSHNTQKFTGFMFAPT